MLTVLSPAKKLLSNTKPFAGKTTSPELMDKASILIKLMKNKSVTEIAQLMDLSKDLAVLNYERYQQFHEQDHSYPALFLFQGDVYQGLQAASWEQSAVTYSQSHLRILSGLYGLLKPLDIIKPYRLEMGSRLENPAGSNLYDFWKQAVTLTLNQQLKEQNNPLLINLASSEYFKAINEKSINYPIVTINFYEQKDNALKMIGIHAKKARGTMAKFIMQNQIDDLEGIKSFTDLGYQFNSQTSNEQHLDFVRLAP